MSKVEQGSQKAGAAKKNKIDTDNFDLGGETPIERMDIVLPGHEEIGAGLEHENQQPLESGLNAPASQSPGNNSAAGQNANSNNQDPSANNAPASENTSNPDSNVEVQNTPSLDGVDLNSVQSGAGAPLAPELNALDEGSNTSNANQQSSTSSGGGTTTPGGSDEVNVAPTDIVYDNSSVDENASGGTVIATLSTVDANDSDTHTYTIVSDPSGYFEIVGDEIRLKEGADLDFETAPLHEITIQATDSAGNSFTETMTIDLNDLNEHDVGAVTDTDSAANTIAENASAGDAIGVTASATDADGTNNTVTYSVDDARFEVASDGTVTVASGASFDAETEGSIDIEVTATSADGSTSTETFSINVSDIDEFDVGAVSDSNASSNAVDENASVGDTVGITALASDGDVTDGVTYSLSDDAGGLFDIDANTGVVTVAGSLDAETDTSHTIEVTATSDDGSTSTQTFSIGVNDVNETSITAISDTDGSGNSVTEGASVGTAVGITALASDADATDTVSYSLSSNSGGFFAIDANTGEVTVAGSLDYETDTSHTIEVTATSSDGTTSTQTFTIAVGDEDEHDVSSISDTDTSANTIAEDVSNGDSVGITASATDADGSNNTVTYSLSDDAGGIFEIDASTGEVSIADASGIDYETATSHTIEVTATSADGSTSTQSYTINVTDVDEFDIGAVTDTDSATNTIAENASAGDEVGVTASASDADGTNNAVTYSVDDARFEVASDGTVTVASGASFDAETESSIDIEVTATSADGSTSTETFSINVSDIDEFDVGAVSDSNSTTNAIDEDASVGDTVGITALASDGDVTDGVTYSLSDDAGGLFDIDANTGVVTVAGSLDAETSTSHTIEVTATSDDGSTSTQTFAIGVNDVNETSITAISDTDASGNTVTEGASVGTAVGITAFASDADATDTISYSLSSNPGGFFAIDANTGEVTVAGSLDYETDTSHTIEVTATSSDGTTSTQTFTIAVGDEAENVQLADGGVTFTDTGVTETSVSGGTGDDNITGTSGDDVIAGNSGDDIVNAGDGNDKFDDSASGNGNDTVNMGAGDDYAYGGDGSDVIDGGTGEDFIHGEDGNDTLTGGADDDTIRGGDGVDIAVFSGDRTDYTISHSESPYYDGGVWTVTGPDGTDTVMEIETFRFDDGDYSAADLQETADQTIVGTVNDDVLNGGSGNDTISGLTGDDVVNAGAGDDRFDDTSTGNGNDTLNMGEGNDTAYGGDGTDTIHGDEGDDKLYGESGNDTITGGEGNDAIDGGTGDDTVVFSGNWADYTITESGGTYTVVDNRPGSPDGTDTVRNVEFFEFADGTTTADDVIDVGPSDIDLSSTSIDENSSAGTVVATLSAEDNSLDVQSYTITNDPSGFFEISGDQVVVKAGADIDFENATSHDITIEVSDGAGSTYTETITINVADIDEFDVGAVTDTDGTANTIAENASAGDEVGVTASATDADGTNNTVTYSVDDARFEVASDGTVTVASGASFDAETEGSIDIEVTATSADGSTSTETFSINVSDIDEFDVGSISDTDGSANTIAEDVSNGDSVGITASASDGDVTDGVTYSLSDDAGGIFEIDASTGEVSIADASGIDYETATSHTIEVTATSADGSTSTQSYTINVTDVDEFDVGAVTDADGTANTIAENASAGDEVGVTASATDADGTNNTVTYSVDDARFEVASDGTITVASGASFDAETEGSIDIEVTATSADGSTSTETFSINVSDIDEFDVGAVSDSNSTTNAVDEDASVGDTVGITALASDGDVTDGVTYSLSDDAGGLFDIDANTGVVTVAGSLDAETSTSHTIEVTATSDDGSTSTQTFSIGVNDVNETSITAISDSDASGNSVTEGASVGTAVGITALATDADATDTVSYSLSSNPGGFFAIDANTGEVTVAGSLDYETDTSHTIEVTATSSDGTTSTQTFTIAVGDENEGPTDISFTGGSVDETVSSGGTIGTANDPSGSTVATLSATDEDAGETFTYAITNDPSGHFEIVGNEVRVKSNQEIDYEAAQSHDITIEVTDAGGNTYTETITINVQDYEGSASGTSGHEYFQGTSEEDQIKAGEGHDTILGGDGDDSISAGDGNDAIIGGAGADAIDGGDGEDTARYDGSSSGVSVDLSSGTGSGGDAEGDTLKNVENLQGSSYSDKLAGDAGENTIHGMSGDDYISGGDGADTLDGGSGSDEIDGGAGADTIYGGSGDDNLDGGADSDVLQGDSGNDTIDGGDGEDTAVYTGNWADYTITESGGTYKIVDNRPGSPDGTDTVTNVEDFEFADGTVAVADLLNVGPSDIDVSSSSVDENSSAGTVVATLSTTDNALDTHTYSITKDPSGLFEISGDQIVVKAGADIDYENATSHDILVEVTDAAGETYSETITINVSDIDEFDVGAVSDTDSAANTIAENASAGDAIGVTASATDADGTNNTVTYSVDDARFEVASDGTVTVASGASFDAETEGSIDIEVTATSADGSTSTETFSINVSDIDEFDVGAISDSNATTNAVDEDASVGDTVGITALASDGDVTDGVTYSLSDDAGGLFDIDANTGVVTVAGSLDAETSTSHTIEVTATSDDGSTSTQTFAIGVNDVNETSITAISDTDASGNSVTEGASVGTAVGITAFASDTDATDTVSYSLSSNPGGFFAIDANTGEVTVAGSLDYETDTSHTIEVTATSSDGTTSTQTFTIAVGDEDEHDVGSISDTDTSANTIAEDVSNGDSVGITASATDADGSNNTVTYSLSDDAGGIFEIDASTGEVSIADASGIDYETATSHTIEVTATSADGSTSTQTMTVNVSDVVDENPTDIQLTGTSGNLIQNGSFEEFNVSNGGVRTFSTDSTGAWETDTTMEVWDSYGSVSATDGNQHLELDSGSAVDNISQTISTTNGQVYDMSIDVMERSGSSSSDTVEIYWNGELVTTIDPGTSWETVDFQVVGTGGNDVFEMREPSSENNGVGALIDNVVMEEVPLTIAEGVDGAVIGTLTTTDADASDSHTYTISDARFEVVDDGAGNMQLKLKAGESFDYETETSVDITVTTTDAAGNNYNEDFTITVADVSDLNPTDLTLEANENLDITTVDAVLNDAVVTGEIVHDGDAFGGTNGGASVDHWQINHNGGDLVIDALADGLNGDDLDVKIMLYLDDGAGNFTLVASNDDGSRGADGSTSSYDSYISETNLAAGTYMVAVGNYHMDGDAATNTSMTHPGDDYSGSYNHGPYQLTISGNNTVEYADHPTGSGTWGDPDGHAVVVSDGADVQGSETLAAGSVIGSVDNVVDMDTNETFTFALTDDAGGKFEIDADTGEIKLVAEHDASSAYSDTVDVLVTDAGGNTYTETVGIQLGTENGETLTGTANSDIMHGFGGQDTLNGGDGDDVLVASDGTAGAVEELTLNDTGTDGVASVSNLFSVDLDEISYEVNLTVDNIPSGGANIVSYATMDGSSMHDNEFTIMLNSDGSLRIIINQTSNVNTGPLATDLTDGSEHRLSVTWDNTDGSVKVYVDGAEEFSITGVATNNMIDGGGTLTLGQEQDSVGGSYDSSQIFSGTMDDVRIFNDVRTATEIADNHDSQLADPSSTSNLVANWQFDGESGTTVTDLANHYDLTLSGDASLEEGAVVGDTLNGGDGDDIMISATGNDTIDGGAGTDTVSYEGSDSAVNVNLNTDTLSGGDAEGDTLTSIENVTGSDHNDTLTGDYAANTLVGGDGNDTLDGLSGKDTLDGGAGDDILMAGFDDGTGDIFIGGEGNDTYQIEGSTVENYGFNVDLNTGSDQYNNSYSGIENINGGNGNDTFTGDANANIFSGGGGNDTMYGGDEGDIFVFGEGDGADTVHGGAGGGWTDTIELTDAGGDLGTYGSDWTVSLTSGSIDAQDANSLTLSDDADGTITLADGSTLDFFEIERIEF